MRLKTKIYLLTLFCCVGIVSKTYAIAASFPMQPFELHLVEYHTRFTDWVESATVELVIEVYAQAQGQPVTSLRREITEALEEKLSAKWQVVQMNLSETHTGAEQVYMQFKTRIPHALASGVHEKVKAISIPGRQYRLLHIGFEPTMTEIEAALAQLRDKAYSAVAQEIQRLSKHFPDTQARLHRLQFNPAPYHNPQLFRTLRQNTMKAATMEDAVSMEQQSVQHKLVLEVQASIELVNHLAFTSAQPDA